MQSSSNEWSTLVSGKAKMWTNKSYYIMPNNSRANEVFLLTERYETKSNVKLDGFRSQLQASYASSRIEELWYKETVCLWMTIYIEVIWVLFFSVTLCVYIYIYIYIYIYTAWSKKTEPILLLLKYIGSVSLGSPCIWGSFNISWEFWFRSRYRKYCLQLLYFQENQ